MSEGLHPAQIAALRTMTPDRRLELCMGFIENVRELRRAMIEQEHPDWSQERVAQALRDFVLHARS